MGRHADSTRKRGFHVSVGIVSIVLVVLCAVGLGIWWWSLKSVTDPIDANPVDAYGLVVSSPSCTQGGTTKVTVSGTNPPVTATLDACGYRVGEQLPIQYLAGHPETVRLAGTSTAGSHSMAGRLLPIGILAAGVIAVLATIALLVDRRRSRHQAAPAARRSARTRVPAPAAVGAGGAASGVGGASAGGAASAGGTASAGGGVSGGPSVAGSDQQPTTVPIAAAPNSAAPDGAVLARAAPSPPVAAGPPEVMFPETGYGAVYRRPGYPEYQRPGEPETGFQDLGGAGADPGAAADPDSALLVEEGMLFTHTNPEPPEPAGAPVHLTGDEDDTG